MAISCGSIAWHRDLDLAILGQERLRTRPVAAIAWNALLVPRMSGQLGAKRLFDQRLLELLEQPFLAWLPRGNIERGLVFHEVEMAPAVVPALVIKQLHARNARGECFGVVRRTKKPIAKNFSKSYSG